jgi:hypothetical protein
MKSVIDKTFPFDQAKQAFSHIESGAHFGKVAIAIGPATKMAASGHMQLLRVPAIASAAIKL